MAKLRIEDIDEGVLEGYITIGGTEIMANLDLEDDNAKKEEDFKNLILQLERFADYFTEDKQKDLKESVAKEVVDASFEQDEQQAEEDDYKSLEDDLKLFDIYVFDEGFVLTFSAENSFPGCDVVVQIDEDGMIDDIAVYDSDDWELENEDDE